MLLTCRRWRAMPESCSDGSLIVPVGVEAAGRVVPSLAGKWVLWVKSLQKCQANWLLVKGDLCLWSCRSCVQSRVFRWCSVAFTSKQVLRAKYVIYYII